MVRASFIIKDNQSLSDVINTEQNLHDWKRQRWKDGCQRRDGRDGRVTTSDNTVMKEKMTGQGTNNQPPPPYGRPESLAFGALRLSTGRSVRRRRDVGGASALLAAYNHFEVKAGKAPRSPDSLQRITRPLECLIL